MEILGYGEDAITYWALTHRLEAILEKLKDSTNASKCLVFYRPSFGRAGKTKGKNGNLPRGPQFGEFDAIIATPQAIYLIESKWNKSSRKRKEKYRVEKRQRWRHQVMTAYILQWLQAVPAYDSWDNFLRDCSEKQFDLLGRKYNLPKSKSRLAHNLELILNMMRGYGPSVTNVLLYLKRKDDRDLDFDHSDSFLYIPIDYPPADNFIRMQS
jgi:hypothetical protein